MTCSAVSLGSGVGVGTGVGVPTGYGVAIGVGVAVGVGGTNGTITLVGVGVAPAANGLHPVSSNTEANKVAALVNRNKVGAFIGLLILPSFPFQLFVCAGSTKPCLSLRRIASVCKGSNVVRETALVAHIAKAWCKSRPIGQLDSTTCPR